MDGKTCGQCKYLGQDCTDEEPKNRACDYFEPLPYVVEGSPEMQAEVRKVYRELHKGD